MGTKKMQIGDGGPFTDSHFPLHHVVNRKNANHPDPKPIVFPQVFIFIFCCLGMFLIIIADHLTVLEERNY